MVKEKPGKSRKYKKLSSEPPTLDVGRERTLADFCDRCGDCCRDFSIRLHPDESLLEALKLKYGDGFRDNDVHLLIDKNGDVYIRLFHPCQFLINRNECMIYDERPEICRSFYCSKVRNRYDAWKSLHKKDKGKDDVLASIV